MNIYLAAKRRGIYPLLATGTGMNIFNYILKHEILQKRMILLSYSYNDHNMFCRKHRAEELKYFNLSVCQYMSKIDTYLSLFPVHPILSVLVSRIFVSGDISSF